MMKKNKKYFFKSMNINTEIDSGNPQSMPKSMKTSEAIARNQNTMAKERTEFAKIRTDLALTNTLLAINRTHLAYLRTIVSLLGSAAMLYKTLPLLNISQSFTNCLCVFLILASIYFIYKDATTYPKMKRRLHDMEEHASELAKKTEDQVYSLRQEEIPHTKQKKEN